MPKARWSAIVIAMAMLLACALNLCPDVQAKKPQSHAPHTQTPAEQPPLLHGSTSGDSGEADSPSDTKDEPDVQFNTKGTVRYSNLANFEALVNIIANLSEINGLACAGSLLWVGLYLLIFANKKRVGAIILASVPIIALSALAFPGIFNWLIASARDANLFS